MRVLVAHSFYRLAGGEDRHVDQQVSLLERFHDVALLGPRNIELAATASTAARMVFSPDTIQEVRTAIKGFKPDVIHLHNAYPSFGPAVHIAAERDDVPLLMTVHNLRLRCPNGLMFTEGSLCNRCESGNYLNAVIHECFPARDQASAYALSLWTHRFILRLEKKVSLFICPSKFMSDRLASWGITRERTEVVRNFTDEDSLSSEPFGEYGIYVGRLSSEKGLTVLLRALAVAGDPPFKIVGEGPQAGALEELAAELSLRRIEFTGRLEPHDVGELLRKSRFLVMPSLCNENAPLAALEAMACGRPLVVSRLGGLPELVDQGAGIAFNHGDEHELAIAITKLIEDADLCTRAGEAALTFARSEITPQIHAERLEKAYRRAIALH